MMKLFAKGFLASAMIVSLAGCALLGDEQIPLEGNRISVLIDTPELRPDYSPEQVKIRLPKPAKNSKWAQSGGNALHNMGHLAAREKQKAFWNESFGAGSSKRDLLISSPIVAYKVVFAVDADGIVTARRLDSGEMIWKRRLKPLNKDEYSVAMKGAGLAEFDKKIFATTGFGSVFALDMLTGNILWRIELGTPIRIAPTIENNILFAQTIENQLIAINTQNGEKLWDYKTSIEATTLIGGASPAYSAEKDVVIAAFSNGELRAFKASTGTPLWTDMLVSRKRTNSLTNITAIKANPVIDEDKVFAIGNSNIMAAIDLRTGSRIWEKEISGNNQPWAAGNYIYTLSNNFDLVAFEKNTGKILWNTNVPVANGESKGGIFATGPVLVENRLIVTTSNGYVFTISPYTGDIISYISLSEDLEIAPIVAEGVTIFTTGDAELLTYK